jgi:hypothetical protein
MEFITGASLDPYEPGLIFLDARVAKAEVLSA